MVQFRRAIADGTFAWIEDALKNAVGAAYKLISNANAAIEGYLHKSRTESAMHGAVFACREPIGTAIESLRSVL